MKSKHLFFNVVLVLLLFGAGYTAYSGCTPAQSSPPVPVDPVERGAYLVSIMGCNDCHTPLQMGPQGPEPDMTRMLSGHPESITMPPAPSLGDGSWAWIGAGTSTAFAGPWGVSYAANLTPDETGLKGWTQDMFVRAIKTGWHMGVENSRRIQPPMPWPAYRNATEEDLQAVFAYLQTIPPVHNAVPAYQPPSTPRP